MQRSRGSFADPVRRGLPSCWPLVLLLSSLLVTGCRSAPTRFFVLTPLRSATAAPGGRRLALGLEPVRLPPLLDRPHIVTQVDDQERRLAEFARWAEPLDENVTRVLAENLSLLLGSERVVRLPSVRALSIERRLAVEVLRFEGTPQGEVLLEVRWRLYDPGSGDPLISRHERCLVTVAGDGEGALVAAMSEALAELGRRLVAGLLTPAAGVAAGD